MIRIDLNTPNTQFSNRLQSFPGNLSQLILMIICLLIFLRIKDGYHQDYRPQGVHFWAQADRFSIARNYYDNGLNFFEPQTNFLENSNGKTGVEFPLIQYLSAVVTKVFAGREDLLLIYRTLSFLILMAGIYFVSLIVKIHSGNGWQQILIPLFLLLSPLLLFYGFNLLPDTSSLSFILIAYYYFEKFRLKIDFNAIYFSIGIACFAGLLKITALLFPVAFYVWTLLSLYIVDKEISKQQILRVSVFFILCFIFSIGVNYFFSIRANSEYGSSVFLSTSRHINRWTDFSDIWKNVVCWHREYFRETQYWVLLVSFLIAFLRRDKLKELQIFKGILLVGIVCFILLMGKQLMHHDYYAICTLVPVMFMLSIDGLMLLSRGCLGSIILLYIVWNLAPESLAQSEKRQADVYNLPCREIWDFRTYMIEGEEWVKSNEIPNSAVFFVLYDYPLNTPLVYLDRKGMVFNHQKMKDRGLIDHWFGRLKPDYLLMPKQWKKEFESDRPDLLEKCDLIFDGKEILVYKPRK
ncbi:MAG: hypothetical protein H6605_00380 [Flavobacteriales bacterium]|nr:hypothetical protein [Flavobacteriales bacterium]